MAQLKFGDGLMGLEERGREAGGTFFRHSEPNRGLQVKIVLPRRREPPEA